jgi:hypothetical protein
MGDLSLSGITKDKRNQQQGYAFRGIDDVFNALSPIMSRHGLAMLPRVLSRTVTERSSAQGKTLFYVVVDVEFDLVCAEDGSAHVIRTYGEAMDSADKATNKAMSAAYKYAALQAFCIPTEGDNDADATTHEVASGITSAQLSELIDLCAAAGKKPDEVAGAYGVSMLAALPAAKFCKLRDRLVQLAKESPA